MKNIDLQDPDQNAIRKQIEEKYYQHDLSGYSTEELLENEKTIELLGGGFCYPWKPEHDAFSNDERYIGWDNEDKDRITIVMGAFGNNENIFDKD